MKLKLIATVFPQWHSTTIVIHSNGYVLVLPKYLKYNIYYYGEGPSTLQDSVFPTPNICSSHIGEASTNTKAGAD
jgi:hypothetical protein